MWFFRNIFIVDGPSRLTWLKVGLNGKTNFHISFHFAFKDQYYVRINCRYSIIFEQYKIQYKILIWYIVMMPNHCFWKWFYVEIKFSNQNYMNIYTFHKYNPIQKFLLTSKITKVEFLTCTDLWNDKLYGPFRWCVNSIIIIYVLRPRSSDLILTIKVNKCSIHLLKEAL